MAQRSRDFDEFLRQSLCAAAASVMVADDGLDRIWSRLTPTEALAAVDNRAVAPRGGARAAATCRSGWVSLPPSRWPQPSSDFCRRLTQAPE